MRRKSLKVSGDKSKVMVLGGKEGSVCKVIVGLRQSFKYLGIRNRWRGML